MSDVQDRPKTNPSDFMAQRDADFALSVKGKAMGDYRIESVSLVRAAHQPNGHTLSLDVHAKVGPAQPVHSEIERVFPLDYVQRPAGEYTHVEINNGHQHFTLKVT